MRVQHLQHDLNGGWSAAFPAAEAPLVFAFGAPAYRGDDAPLQALAAAYPGGVVVGCSTSGEIHNDEVLDDSISVAVVDFERTTFRAHTVACVKASASAAAGRALAEALAAPDLKAVLLLSEGLTVNGTALVEGVNSVLPEGVVVTGGLAGDGADFGSTWVFSDGKLGGGRVVAVGLYGDDVVVGHGSRGGWDAFGPQRKVTRSTDNVLFELDGSPALALYKEYLGERAAGLPATGLLFPLLITRDGHEESLVRTILAVDEAEQSLTFAGDIPQGATAQLMRANFDRLVEGAAGAGTAAAEIGHSGDTLSLAVSCVGRRLVLRERAEDECEAALDELPDNTVQVGYYSYGELSPNGAGRCDLHNQTMTLTTISERASS